MSIAKAALLIMLGNAASRLLGVVRVQVIAVLFGASSLTDAFTAASRIPTSIFDLLIGGMISAALVPVFSGYTDDKDSKEIWRIASIVMNLAGLVLLFTVGVLFILAPQLMSIFGGGYDAETQSTAVVLLRIMLPSVLFMGIGGILTGLHYSQHSFRIPSLCVALYNASMVIIAMLFHETLGINSLVIGVLVGSFLQMFIQFLGLKKMRYSLTLDLSHPAIRKILTLYLPVGLGLVISNIGVAIDTNLASQTGEGSLAAMGFATTLTQFPLGLVASAVSFAVLPSLSRSAAATISQIGSNITGKSPDYESGEDHGFTFKSTLSFGLKMIILTIFPATTGLIVLREPIIQVLFEHGRFDAFDTSQTALAFLAYSPGLPAAAIDQLLIFAFYARKNTLTPVMVGVLGVGVYLVVAISLIGPLGMPGLALANSAQLTAHALIMLALLWRAVGGLGGFGLTSISVKALASSLIMGAFCYSAALYVFPQSQDANLIYRITALSLISIAGFLIYGTAIVLLRVEETKLLWSMVKARMGR